MQNLKGEHFKLWLYLALNQNGYEFALSQKACENWGIKKDTYYRSVDALKEHRYLVELEPGVFQFKTAPQKMEPQKSQLQLSAEDF